MRVIHNKAGAGCSASGTDGKGFANPGCHAPNKDMAATPMTCGTGAGGCHQNHTDSNHIVHPANQPLGTVVGSLVATYTYGNNVGCFQAGTIAGCHFSDLTVEHGSTARILASIGATTPVAAERTMNGSRGASADGCSVCHTQFGTAGAYAARSAIQSAITNGDYRCTSCHFESTDAAGTTGVQAPHKSTRALADAPLGATAEWGLAGAQGGGHNSFGVSFPRPDSGPTEPPLMASP